MTQHIRDFKRNAHANHRIKVGERNGFTHWCCFATCDRYVQGEAPNGNRYIDNEVGMRCTFAVEKDGIWIVWNPGWGIDCHWPADNAPKYLSNSGDNPCEYVGGKCKSDGSSLADGEKGWPAFNYGGLDAVFSLLTEWWRPANYGDDDA